MSGRWLDFFLFLPLPSQFSFFYIPRHLGTYLKEDEVGVRFRHREKDQCEGRRDSAVQNGGAHLGDAGERPLLAGAWGGGKRIGC